MIVHLVSWDGSRHLWVKLDSIIALERTTIKSNDEELWNIIGNGYSILVKEVPREIGKFY